MAKPQPCSAAASNSSARCSRAGSTKSSTAAATPLLMRAAIGLAGIYLGYTLICRSLRPPLA